MLSGRPRLRGASRPPRPRGWTGRLRLLAILFAGVAVGAAVGLAAGLPAPLPSLAADAGPATALVAAPATGWAAPLPAPLVVTRAFSPPAGPYAAGHRGVDLAAAVGTPVRAAGAGTVVFAGMLAGRSLVSVRHANGLRTTYEPLAGLVVRRGQAVAAGDPLGRLAAGHPGCPAAACLHWGLLTDGPPAGYLDPLLLLGRGPPRLLPLGEGRAG